MDLHDARLSETYRFVESTTVRQGDEIIIHFVVGNRGSAAAPAAKIRFHASTDTQITTEDYQISGEGTLTPLALNQVQRFEARRTTENLLQGRYHVGWIIDPENAIPESEDWANNIGVIDTEDYRLVVLGL